MNTKKPLKMYVLVRKDLDETYRNVQGEHAALEYPFYHWDLYNEWHNSTLVHLGVRNVWALERWKDKLEEAGKPFAYWNEPDMQGQLTAIACIDTGEIFKNLRLA